MTVTITRSATSGGVLLADTVDMGTVTPSNDVDFQDIFISHDAIVAPITDCALYVTRYAGSNYLGTDADADITLLLGWGDAATGGIQMSMTPDSPWTTGTPFSTGWATFANGLGDVDSQISLDEDAITTGTPAGDGVIPVAGEAHIQVKVAIPAAPGTSGYKAFSLVIAYSATS